VSATAALVARPQATDSAVLSNTSVAAADAGSAGALNVTLSLGTVGWGATVRYRVGEGEPPPIMPVGIVDRQRAGAPVLAMASVRG